ncbi:MAG: hypothetical protein ABL998_00530 [Planctomycetota bacterium]
MATHGNYEHSDARTGPLWVAGVVLALVLIGSLWVSRRIDRRLTAGLAEGQATSPIAELRQAPDAPELQAVPSVELELLRAEEERLLHSPASWIDPVNGIVRLPIEEALEKVLGEGFPVRTEEKR